jgi:peptidoglycan/xylan/chitin deacetylase (PgdA/CDA1 family)
MLTQLANALLPDAVVLSLHGIGEPHADVDSEERRYWIDRNRFRRLVLETLDAAQARGLVPVFTFDDANLSDYSEALPLLLELGLTARFYVPVRRIGRPEYLTVGQLREIARHGMVVGSHGLDHVRWTELSDRELEAETADARRALEDMLGIEVVEAACPFGALDARVFRQLRRAGFSRILTSYMATTRLDGPLVDRFPVTETFEAGRDLVPRIGIARRCLDVMRRRRQHLRLAGLPAGC